MHLTKWKLAIAVVAIFSLGATAAYAGSVFDDVDDGQWYSAPIEWARDNGITTGCGDNNFCPTDPVTRRENVTFAYRYDQNIVQPALEDIEDDVQDNDEEIDDLETLLPLFATIQDTGTPDLGNRGLVSSERNSEGDYTLTFDRDISECAVATNDIIFSGNHEISASVYSGLVTQVRVVVRNASDVLEDTWFSIVIHCPLPSLFITLDDESAVDPNG